MILQAVCTGSTEVSEALNQDTLINRTFKNEEQKPASSDLWSMVASMRGNADSTAAQKYDQSSRQHSLQFDWGMDLDQHGLFHLDWSVNYAANLINFSLGINRTLSKFHEGSDVFALGFSKDGQLSSSDFCIIWYDLGHRLHLQDAFANADSRLELVDASKSHCKLVEVAQPEDAIVGRSKLEQDADSESNHVELEVSADKLSEAEDTRLRVVFKRPLDVCVTGEAGQSYYQIDNGTTHLVWFSIKGPLLSLDGLNMSELSASRPRDGGHFETSGHEDREHNAAKGRMMTRGDNGFSSGMKRAQLIAVKPPATKRRRQEEGAGSARKHEIRMESFHIPARETTYWCKLFKFPHKFVQRRYHITRYEAVIEKANEHVVHHMELFNCANLDESQESELEQLYKRDGGWSGDCNGGARPPATKTCKRVILAWAMGAHPLEYPDQVGQSVGGRGYSPYVVLEVHYNNVEKSAGLIDNSGLSFQYTSRLRPYDAGILEVGLEYSDKNSIPPGQVFPLAGHCVSECTRAAMTAEVVPSSAQRSGSRKLADNEGEALAPDLEGGGGGGGETSGGIYIFAAQMHTHLAGVATWTEHVRQGRLVSELQRDNHYSPHFQEIRLLSEPVHVVPGDALIHYCLYDTRNRANITLGGYATSDEMCVTYLHYYPRIDLELCKSSIDTQALEAYFAYLAREEGQNTSLRLNEELTDGDINRSSLDHTIGGATSKSVKENYRSIQWTPKRARELLQLYSEAPLSVQCNRSNGDRFPGYWSGIAPTKLWADIEGAEPFSRHQPSGRQLLEYRGSGFGRRHEQCARREQSH